jgi:hypothetical protein
MVITWPKSGFTTDAACKTYIMKIFPVCVAMHIHVGTHSEERSTIYVCPDVSATVQCSLSTCSAYILHGYYAVTTALWWQTHMGNGPINWFYITVPTQSRPYIKGLKNRQNCCSFIANGRTNNKINLSHIHANLLHCSWMAPDSLYIQCLLHAKAVLGPTV